MKIGFVCLFIFLLSAANLLSACGQTGKLYLPNGEQKVVVKVPQYGH